MRLMGYATPEALKERKGGPLAALANCCNQWSEACAFINKVMFDRMKTIRSSRKPTLVPTMRELVEARDLAQKVTQDGLPIPQISPSELEEFCKQRSLQIGFKTQGALGLLGHLLPGEL